MNRNVDGSFCKSSAVMCSNSSLKDRQNEIYPEGRAAKVISMNRKVSFRFTFCLNNIPNAMQHTVYSFPFGFASIEARK